MKAIILAGGHSVRFGKPKAFAEVNGETFYSRVIKTLESTNMFNEIIIQMRNWQRNLNIQMLL